jgi:hypothetical protein
MTNDEKKQRVRRVRVGNVEQMDTLKRELARLYRACRRTAGPNPEPATGAQLARILSEIRGVIVDHEAMARLAALEARVINPAGKRVPGAPLGIVGPT